MANTLLIPHRRQETETGCLPACAQMVLDSIGIHLSQSDLARIMESRAQIGTPKSNIQRLASVGVRVDYGKEATLSDLQTHLDRGNPIICFVQTAQLPYRGFEASQHAVVVVGLSAEFASVLDPDWDRQVVPVPVEDFLLAWDEMELAYAVIQRAV